MAYTYGNGNETERTTVLAHTVSRTEVTVRGIMAHTAVRETTDTAITDTVRITVREHIQITGRSSRLTEARIRDRKNI